MTENRRDSVSHSNLQLDRALDDQHKHVVQRASLFDIWSSLQLGRPHDLPWAGHKPVDVKAHYSPRPPKYHTYLGSPTPSGLFDRLRYYLKYFGTARS